VAGAEVVDRDDPVTGTERGVDDVRTDEPGTAGYCDPHAATVPEPFPAMTSSQG
jgi:hypothetical protein